MRLMESDLKSVEHDELQNFSSVKLFFSRYCKDERLSQELKSLVPLLPSAECSTTQDWLKWCRSRRDVQLVEAAVPSAVLLGATLTDIKVGGRRHQPDDSIYNRNPDIRQRVARGNCVLQLRDGRSTCLIHALKKFTDYMGDEDDDSTGGGDATWRRYFLSPLDNASRLVLTQKANGEAAHLSVRFIDDAFLVCVGSKNVHMVLRRAADISLYSDQRYRVAREVAAAVWRLLAALEEQQRRHLLSFLHHTRFTAVMELLQPDHQHVEDLSHLEVAELRFIAWTPTYQPEGEAAPSFCGCSPELGFRLAQVFGLKPVDHSVEVDNFQTKLPQLMDDVRRGYGYEGKVLYFVDESGNVIGLLKKKTAWYVLLRALREQLCYGLRRLAFADLKSNIQRRFQAIQVWLGLDDRFVNDWVSLGVDFAEWLKGNPDTDYATLRTEIPPLWNRFLREMDRTDEFILNTTK